MRLVQSLVGEQRLSIWLSVSWSKIDADLYDLSLLLLAAFCRPAGSYTPVHNYRHLRHLHVRMSVCLSRCLCVCEYVCVFARTDGPLLLLLPMMLLSAWMQCDACVLYWHIASDQHADVNNRLTGRTHLRRSGSEEPVRCLFFRFSLQLSSV